MLQKMVDDEQSQLGADAERLLENIAKFERRFPGGYEILRERLAEITG